MTPEITATEMTLSASPTPSETPVFSNSGFELAQRMATALSKSDLVPTSFRGNVPNCLIALEMAMRMGASPMAVMQNLYIVHGRPAWSSQFIIAAINATKRFSPLRFAMSGEGGTRECFVWATELGTGERLEGPSVSIAMAKAEGWLEKNGSKWLTMPELMLRYRAATFFGRLYAPDILMGMKEETEVIETVPSSIERARITDVSAIGEKEEPSLARQEMARQEMARQEMARQPEEKEAYHGEMAPSAPPPRTKLRPKKKPPEKEVEKEYAEASAAPDRPQLARLSELLDGAGYTHAQLFAVAKENNWTQEEDKELADMPEDKLAAFVDDWVTCVELLVEQPQPAPRQV